MRIFLVGLIIFTLLCILAERSCSRPYRKYAIYIQARDETIFEKQLDHSDPMIVDYGRMLKDKIVIKDEDLDNGDGPYSGRLRWYNCDGIDCNEGWESRFLN